MACSQLPNLKALKPKRHKLDFDHSMSPKVVKLVLDTPYWNNMLSIFSACHFFLQSPVIREHGKKYVFRSMAHGFEYSLGHFHLSAHCQRVAFPTLASGYSTGEVLQQKRHDHPKVVWNMEREGPAAHPCSSEYGVMVYKWDESIVYVVKVRGVLPFR